MNIERAMNVTRKTNSQKLALVRVERPFFLSGGWSLPKVYNPSPPQFLSFFAVYGIFESTFDESVIETENDVGRFKLEHKAAGQR